MRIRSRFCADLLLVGFVAAFSLTPLQAQSTESSLKGAAIQQRLPKRLVADYTYGSKYAIPPYDIAQIPFHKLTHINYASIPWGPDGSLQIPSGFMNPELISRAHAAGVQVLLLTGGDFAAAENDPHVLDAVIANLQNFVTANDYDGLDIDWEFPQNATDEHFFNTLMTRLRAALPSPRYTLSIDVAPWNTPFYGVKQLREKINYFNLMVYDCAGPWTSVGHFNSPIFWDNRDPQPSECQPGGSDQQTIDMFLKLVPPLQINMGTPFYGYLYPDINQLFGACPTGSCSTTFAQTYGKNIKQLINQQGWTRHYDSVAMVPYLLKDDGSPGFITYDDADSTYVRVWYSDWTRGVGGTFMWALDEDYDGHSQDLLDAMYRATIKGK